LVPMVEFVRARDGRTRLHLWPYRGDRLPPDHMFLLHPLGVPTHSLEELEAAQAALEA